MIQPPVGNADSTGILRASVTLHAGKNSSVAYQRHEPEKTVLYKMVSEHLEPFLGEVRDHYDKPLPKYVEKELRDYLKLRFVAIWLRQGHLQIMWPYHFGGLFL